VCRPCGEVIALPPAEYALDPAVAELRRPSDLAWSERIEDRAADLIVTPSRWRAVPILAVAAIWDAIILAFYVLLLRNPRTPAFELGMPLLHVAAGAFVTWWGLLLLLNRSRFVLDARQLVLKNGPVPAPGFRASTASVDGFDAVPMQRRRETIWRVRVLLRDGSAKKISLPITTHEHVSFVAARLNAALARVREPRGYRDG
jgi:hypothetical protein